MASYTYIGLREMRSKRAVSFRVILESLLVPAIVLSCSEPFPMYQEPSSVLNAAIEVMVVDTIEIVMDRETGQWYLVSAPMVFSMQVTNTHDDLLVGEAHIEGLIDVTAFTQTPKFFSVAFVEGNLVAPQIVGGELALEPGAEAILQTIAYPVLQNGDLLIDGEPGGPIYGPITCIASGTIRVFGRIQAIESPQIEFQLTFRESYDNP